MILSSIEKISESIGFDIANSNDEVQSNLLNGFSNGIMQSMRDKNNREIQLCYIADKLNKNSIFVIKALSEFIKLKEDEDDKRA